MDDESGTYVEVGMDIGNVPLVVGRISLENHDPRKVEQVRLLMEALAAGEDVRVFGVFAQRERDPGIWPNGGRWLHVQAVEFPLVIPRPSPEAAQ